ncbi:MAG: DUF6334 family protein [Thermoguttaceae bacterium]
MAMPATAPNAEALARIRDDGGPLRALRYVLFDGSPTFVVGVILEFDTLTATILAEPNYDEILVRLTPYEPGPDERVVTGGSKSPWHGAFGLGVRWAWQMTNQQGYTDGLRFEFGDPDDSERSRTVELLVVASQIKLFVARATTP